MAQLGYQKSKIQGGAVAKVAASAGGDTVAPNTRGALLVDNGDAAAHTVTVAVPGNTRYGQAAPDVDVPVAAGATVLVGPFDQDLADPADGLVHITYDAVTSVQVAAVAI